MVCKIILKKKKKKSNDLVYHIDVLPLELHLFFGKLYSSINPLFALMGFCGQFVEKIIINCPHMLFNNSKATGPAVNPSWVSLENCPL